jgi:hypothetical protein
MEYMREEGYDFYEVEVLNVAFKKAVKLVNVVGRGLAASDEASNVISGDIPDDNDDDDDDRESPAL